jgi:DNA-binding CsgD family transcriptional regulator
VETFPTQRDSDATSPRPEPAARSGAPRRSGGRRVSEDDLASVIDVTARLPEPNVRSQLSARQAAFLTDLQSMSADAQSFVDVAAVFGDAFAVDDVAEVLGETVGKVLPALRETLAAEVVVPRSDLLHFRHQWLREAVLAQMPEPVRLALHRQVGAVLLGRGGSPAAAAAHLIAGTRQYDHQALSALDRAAIELTTLAPEAAADLAVRVLELTDASDDDRFTRSAAAVDALVAARRIREAKRLARDTLGRPGAPAECVARIRLTLSAILFMCGQPARAVAEAEAVLADRALPDELCDAADFARVLGLLALNDVPRAEAAAEEILAGGERRRGDTAIAAATTALASIAWDQGRVDIAIGLARASVQRAAHRPRRGQHPRLGLAAMLIAVGDFAEAATLIRQADEEIENDVDALWSVLPPLLSARLHLAAGRPDDAVVQSQQALAIADRLDSRMFAPVAFATLAQAALLRGDLRSAAEHAERCRVEPGPPRLRLGPATYAWTQARIADATDGPASAMEILTDLYEPLSTAPILLVEEPCAASWLTRTALAVGDRGRADMVAACAEQLARSNPGVPSIATAAAHAHDLLDQDAAELESAAGDYRHPWASASAFEDAGVLHARGGDRESALAAFAQALTTYDQVGADRDAARIRSRLRDLGVRGGGGPRADRPAAGWLSLTAAEHQVATIVAEGLTNAQVADRLFLSRHTVDFHLRKIFRKLDIRSRVELTRLVLEHRDQIDAQPLDA